MQTKVYETSRITNPVTKALRERGMTLTGYALIHKLNYNFLCQVVGGYCHEASIESQLKVDGLWSLIVWKLKKDQNGRRKK